MELPILAFDPGINGGVAWKTPEGYYFASVMPKRPGGKAIDPVAVYEMVRNADPKFIFIEAVWSMPNEGVTSAFTFGKGLGYLEMVAIALGIPHLMIPPRNWKALILSGSAKDKQSAIAYCRKRFPAVSLIPEGCKKPHTGISDALCILEYGEQKLEQFTSTNSKRGFNVQDMPGSICSRS